MQPNEYQQLAMRTNNPDHTPVQMLTNAAMGLNGEAGEFADLLKKHLFQGHPLDSAKLQNELSDVLWYCALAATALNINLEDVMIYNINKLIKRYPEGFSTAASIARVDTK